MARRPIAAALGFLSVATLVPTTVFAQSSPSPYTSAARYDAMGRVVGTIAPDPDGTGPLQYPATRTTYDARGNVIKVETGELQNWKDESIAPASWGTDFDSHIQTTVDTTYDALNRKLTDTFYGNDSVAVSLTQYSYDAVGRLECTAVRMNPAAYGSLPASACTLGTEGAHGPDRITRTIYDAAGQVLQVRKAVGTSLEIADVTYSYTLNGQIEHVVDANGNKAKLEYDGHDRQSKWIFPSKTRPTSFNPATPVTALATAGDLSTDDGNAATDDQESYEYDANGNRTKLVKRDGSIITYDYDALNRMTRKRVPARAGLAAVHTRHVFYSYDLRGLQTNARFNSITGPGVRYTYDGFGRLTEELQNTSGTASALTAQFDANGNRTRITHPDGYQWNFEYDQLNRLTNLRQNTWLMGTATYTDRGLPKRLVWTNGTNFRDFDYDAAGRLDQIFINLNGTSQDVTWDYTRNPASQILTETQSNDSYSWDGHVNLTRPYTTNGLNQYTAAGSAAFCYDGNGNLTADGTSVYLYDVENRLVEARDQTNTNCMALSYGGTLRAELRYDPTGRLYQISGGSGGTQRFVYDGNALVLEYDGSNVVQRRYVHGSNIEADDPLVWYEGSAGTGTGRRFVHADPRGSIVAVTDYLGNAIATNSYDEFGIPDTASGGATDIATKGRFRYTGQAWIPEIGMYYYKARVYSPTLGRFLQSDPIGYEDQFNLYAYVGNDPINGIDPTGMFSRGSCGSRIKGVNNCSGLSFLNFEENRTDNNEQSTAHQARPQRRPGGRGNRQSQPSASDRLSNWLFPRGIRIEIGGVRSQEGGIHNGHTWSAHVGVSVSRLRARLRTDPSLQRASSFSSGPVANWALRQALRANFRKIRSWERDGNPGGSLRINMSFRRPVGTVLKRPTGRAKPAYNASFFIVPSSNSRSDVAVLTGFVY